MPTIRIGKKEWTIRPFDEFQRRELIELSQRMKGAINEELMDISVQTAYVALHRDFPELQKDELEDLLDNNTIPPMLETILAAMGFPPKNKLN